jgi:hypothetical protein
MGLLGLVKAGSSGSTSTCVKRHVTWRWLPCSRKAFSIACISKYAIPPWLWATQMSKGMGVILSRVKVCRISILPTTGPLPCVMMSSLSNIVNGNKALAVIFAMAFCSSDVPSISSGCVALPPMATIKRPGSTIVFLDMFAIRDFYPANFKQAIASSAASAFEGATKIPAFFSLAIWVMRPCGSPSVPVTDAITKVEPLSEELKLATK